MVVSAEVVCQEPRRPFGVPTVDNPNQRTFANRRAVTGQPEDGG